MSLHEVERMVFSCRLPPDRQRSILGQRGGEHLYLPPVSACMREDSTMRRSIIGLILTLAFGILVPPLADAAPRAGKVPRLGVLSLYHPSSAVTRQGSPFGQELRERGWVEGRTLEVAHRYAEGHAERLPALATELVQLPVDVLVAEGTQAAQAAKAASDTIPIVFMGVGEPIRAGLVTSLAHPGGNV